MLSVVCSIGFQIISSFGIKIFRLQYLLHGVLGCVVCHSDIVGFLYSIFKLDNEYKIAVCFRSGRYEAGAITVFALNVSPDDASQLVFTDPVFKDQPVDIYLVCPVNSGDVLSKLVDNFMMTLRTAFV
jgi:hypothetical protein